MMTTRNKDCEGSRLTAGAIVICHVDDRLCGGSPAPGHHYARFIIDSFPGLRSGLANCANVRPLGGRHETRTVSAFWLETIQ